MNNAIQSCIVIAMLLVIVGVVGALQTADEEDDRKMYCAMVHDGVWPDYNKTYDKQCPQAEESKK